MLLSSVWHFEDTSQSISCYCYCWLVLSKQVDFLRKVSHKVLSQSESWDGHCQDLLLGETFFPITDVTSVGIRHNTMMGLLLNYSCDNALPP